MQDNQTKVDLANLDGLTTGTVVKLTISKAIYLSTEDDITSYCSAYNKKAVEQMAAKNSAWTPINIATHQCTTSTLSSHGDIWGQRARKANREAVEETCAAYNQSGEGGRLFSPGILEDKSPLPPGYADVCSESTLRIPEGWSKKLDEALAKHLEPICQEYNNPPDESESFININKGQCDYSNLASKDPLLAEQAFQNSGYSSPWLYTLSASTSNNSFKFIDSTMLADHEENHQDYSFTGEVGSLRRGVYYGLSFTGQRQFQGADAKNICMPLNGDSLLCRDVPLGAPARLDQHIWRLEARRFLGERTAGTLRVNFDALNNVWNPHVLLFFIPDDTVKTGPFRLSGGVDVSYNSGTGGYAARLFVGTTFKLLPSG